MSIIRNNQHHLPGLFVALLCAALVGGCGPKYGGRRQQVMLITEPPGAAAYALPYSEWLKHGRDKALSDTAFLETYRVKDSQTPTLASLDPYEHVFIADWNGHREFTRFTPKAGKTVKLSMPIASVK